MIAGFYNGAWSWEYYCEMLARKWAFDPARKSGDVCPVPHDDWFFTEACRIGKETAVRIGAIVG